jgi:pyridoxine kinase
LTGRSPLPSRRKAVIAISSHVARGAVGNRAIVFALETLGHPVWSVPTVLLPWHPGHGPATRIVPDPTQFDALLDDLAQAPWLDEVGAVMTGYLGHACQAAAAARLVEAVRARRPDAPYLCDPVIGDAGGLYVPEATAAAIRDRLLPLASIATPNLFELSWLTGIDTSQRDGALRAAAALPPPSVVVTSAPGTSDERIGNLLVEGGRATLFEHPRLLRPPNGPGDLTAALVLAGLLQGGTSPEAVERATRGVYSVLRAAVARGADELALASDARLIVDPDAQVEARPIEFGD